MHKRESTLAEQTHKMRIQLAILDWVKFKNTIFILNNFTVFY